jgi:hypothetical protein
LLVVHVRFSAGAAWLESGAGAPGAVIPLMVITITDPDGYVVELNELLDGQLR